ncbi:MAG: pilus assembly protein TadG-related protein [Pseudomonadota bacterium]|nr:pilus assembly protein TadG-related protein [Pseudomonadota bacterium]
MRALAWLNKLRRDKSGNVLAITAASMPLIVGGAAMAVDTIQLSVWKRQLQRAADSAAIAGAYAEAQRADVGEAVHRDLDENVFPTLSEPEVVQQGARLGFNRTVYVSLTAERTVPFISFFTNSPNTIKAEATAAVVDEGDFCLLSLYDGTDTGIDANGNATVDLTCGMATNSRSDNAVTAGGTSSIIATPISAVGGLDGTSQNFDGANTTLRPRTAPMLDPFAGLALPTIPANCTASLSVPNNSTPVEIDDDTPGQSCFTSLNIDGTLRLNPGTYYVKGGNIDLKGRIESIGTGGVTIIMTGDQTDSDGKLIVGDFIQNGGGVLDIDAAETGPYRGIALYRDPRAALLTVNINGGAETDIRGAVYMPSTDLWLGGNASFDATCLQVVGRIITFRGGADIDNDCDENGAAQPLRQTVVRLVG